MVHTFHPSTWEAEAGRSQSSRTENTVLKKQTNNNKKKEMKNSRFLKKLI